MLNNEEIGRELYAIAGGTPHLQSMAGSVLEHGCRCGAVTATMSSPKKLVRHARGDSERSTIDGAMRALVESNKGEL